MMMALGTSMEVLGTKMSVLGTRMRGTWHGEWKLLRHHPAGPPSVLSGQEINQPDTTDSLNFSYKCKKQFQVHVHFDWLISTR